MLWDIDLLREMDRMRRDMDSLFTDFQRSGAARTYPLINIYDNSEAVILSAELPGLSKDKVNITFADGVLTLKSKYAAHEAAAEMTPVRQERSSGEFEKSIRIPVKVEQEKINASFENGVLTVVMPKTEEAKPKTIAIEVK